MEKRGIVLRKKEIGGKEKTASVSTLEEWCKGRGEDTGEDSRWEAGAEGEEWVFKKERKVQRSLIRGKEGKEVGEILKEMKELKEEMNRMKERNEKWEKDTEEMKRMIESLERGMSRMEK